MTTSLVAACKNGADHFESQQAAESAVLNRKINEAFSRQAQRPRSVQRCASCPGWVIVVESKRKPGGGMPQQRRRR